MVLKLNVLITQPRKLIVVFLLSTYRNHIEEQALLLSTDSSSKRHVKILAETGAKGDPFVTRPIALIVVFIIKYKVALLCCKLKQNL